MDTLGSRIRSVRKRLKINQTVFARKLGLRGAGAISKYEKNQREPDIAMLNKISEMGNVSLNWLVKGGPEEATYPEVPGKIEIVALREETDEWNTLSEKSLTPPGKKPEELLFINVFALELAVNPKDKKHQRLLESVSLPSEYSGVAPIGLKITGNSMAPTIKDGAAIGLAFRDRKLVEGEVYVVRIPGEGAIVRRVFFAGNNLILKADNRIFPEKTLNLSAIKEESLIVGRVGWILQRP